MRGLDIYTTKDGFTVARLHYTADPLKATEEWIKETEKGYPGRRTGPAWRKEMEIDFTAYSGQLLCYDIIQTHRHKVIKDKAVKETDNKFGSVDWGRNNPASFHTYSVDIKGNIHSCYEIYQNGISIPEFSSLIKSSPYYKDLFWISADPSIWNKTQETKEGLRSLENLFFDEGIVLTKGISRDDTLAINELLDRWNRLDVNEPRLTISPRCPKQIWEFERLRYKELSTAMLDKANAHETLVDKDNHSWDDYKYFISTWLITPKNVETKKPEKHSVAYFMEEDERKKADWRAKYQGA